MLAEILRKPNMLVIMVETKIDHIYSNLRYIKLKMNVVSLIDILQKHNPV